MSERSRARTAASAEKPAAKRVIRSALSAAISTAHPPPRPAIVRTVVRARAGSFVARRGSSDWPASESGTETNESSHQPCSPI